MFPAAMYPKSNRYWGYNHEKEDAASRIAGRAHGPGHQLPDYHCNLAGLGRGRVQSLYAGADRPDRQRERRGRAAGRRRLPGRRGLCRQLGGLGDRALGAGPPDRRLFPAAGPVHAAGRLPHALDGAQPGRLCVVFRGVCPASAGSTPGLPSCVRTGSRRKPAGQSRRHCRWEAGRAAIEMEQPRRSV